MKHNAKGSPATIGGRGFMSTIESPCILVCTIDLASGWCVGCGRTRDEIGGWLAMTPQRRREVMALLPARLEKIERKPEQDVRRRMPPGRG